MSRMVSPSASGAGGPPPTARTRASGSRPVVGSSRNRTPGAWMRPVATSSLRLLPPDQVLTMRSAYSPRPNDREQLVDAAPELPCRPCRTAGPGGACSRGPSPPDRPRPPGRPLRSTGGRDRADGRRRCPGRARTPESGRDSVVRILTVVDLPAPFGPSRPWMVPGWTVRSTPSSARTRVAVRLDQALRPRSRRYHSAEP